MTRRSQRRGTTARLSVAPMMDRTDRHYRWLLRQITRHTLLYTEMVTAHALLRGDRGRLLAYDPIEHPVALQLGGDDPVMMAECAEIAQKLGYDEVNINVGCPSDRVQSGCFGAILMDRPERVADIVTAMRDATTLPVTVKHRIGVDDRDSYEDMKRFVDIVADAGADRFSVHARKAWLSGLSPKENRNIPPLRYEEVWRLKAERPDLDIEINGGICTLDQAEEHLEHVDAVMIGRAVYDDPWLLRDADQRFFTSSRGLAPTRDDLVERLRVYAECELAAGERFGPIARHVLNLFNGQPGARQWRRHLSTHAFRPDADATVLYDALLARDRARANRRAAS